MRRKGRVRQRNGSRRRAWSRAGVSSLDYALILGVVFPLVAFLMWAGPRIIRLAYEMVCLLVSWPFM
jgi:hypothetical protein